VIHQGGSHGIESQGGVRRDGANGGGGGLSGRGVGRRGAAGRGVDRVTFVVVVAATLLAVLIGPASAGTSGPGSGAAVPSGLTALGSSAVGYVPSGLTINRSWTPQTKSIPDFSFQGGSGALMTPRTDVGLRAALSTGLLPLARVRCWDEHAWNPTSDHPLGKACDFMQSYTTSAGRAVGWQLANWLVANQAKLGINYLIWQNQIWNAGRPAAWGPYYSTVYGCPDATNITGCHMDHIHVSFY
jgi:hypothetical protein